jgi:hypothetical protein
VGKEGEAGNVQHCRCSLTPTTTGAAGRSQRVIGIGSKNADFTGALRHRDIPAARPVELSKTSYITGRACGYGGKKAQALSTWDGIDSMQLMLGYRFFQPSDYGGLVVVIVELV